VLFYKIHLLSFLFLYQFLEQYLLIYFSFELLNDLKKFPVTVIVCGNHKVDIKKLLRILKERKIKNLLIEGGGITNWSFIQENLIDEAIVTISPYLLGGSDAPTLVDGNGFSTIAESTKLKLKNVTTMKNEIVLHYKIK